MTHEITNQSCIVTRCLGTFTVRDPCGLNDGGFVTHAIDETHEPLAIECLKLLEFESIESVLEGVSFWCIHFAFFVAWAGLVVPR